MTKYHLKRLPAPRTWRILRKAEKYIARPRPGAHSFDLGMPLGRVMIDLGKATTRKENKNILNNQEVLVDGKKRKTVKSMIGFMDVLSFPKTKENYRMFVTDKEIKPIAIDENEAKIKPVKITGKTSVKGKKTQLKTLDGRSIFIDKDNYKVGDTITIELPSQKIKDHFKLEGGATILLYRGKQAGKVGKLEKIDDQKIIFTIGKDKLETKRSYAFVIGKDKPMIKIE